ncbi:MAG: universal stress protein [Gammaproteobacteria bacterium]|nr:universal stress protein [Gammaproteobacteria bacterium]
MTIKTILLPIRESSTALSLMETSISMAIRNDAHLDLLYVQNDPEQMIPFSTLGLSNGMRQTILESAAAAASQQGDELKQSFLELCERYKVDVKPRGTGIGKPTADFLVRTGRRDNLIGKYGRLADLLIVPQPVKTTPPPSSFEAALRESGRPVLMVQRGKVLDVPGKRLAIGWNSSKEAAQAIAAMLNNLKRADKVYVLSTEKRMQLPINADDVCTYLRCQGITAETAIFNTKGQSAGEGLLARSRELECDRLIVGGYSRPRIRDLIMGGVTGHLLAKADMPVIFVH